MLILRVESSRIAWKAASKLECDRRPKARARAPQIPENRPTRRRTIRPPSAPVASAALQMIIVVVVAVVVGIRNLGDYSRLVRLFASEATINASLVLLQSSPRSSERRSRGLVPRRAR